MIDARKAKEESEQKEQWEIAREICFSIYKAMTGKPSRAKDLWKFPWEKKGKKITKAESWKIEKRHDEVARKLGILK